MFQSIYEYLSHMFGSSVSRILQYANVICILCRVVARALIGGGGGGVY